MNNNLKERIEGMAAHPNISQEQVASLVEGWDKYFARVQIANEVEQEQEFIAIMRARVQVGSISLVAPNTGLQADGAKAAENE